MNISIELSQEYVTVQERALGERVNREDPFSAERDGVCTECARKLAFKETNLHSRCRKIATAQGAVDVTEMVRANPSKTAKASKPETLDQAVTWDRQKDRYLNAGLCHSCAAQAAWGHQNGFATIMPPCDDCHETVVHFPIIKTGAWCALEPMHPYGGTEEGKRLPESMRGSVSNGRSRSTRTRGPVLPIRHGKCIGCGSTWKGKAEHCPVAGCHQTFSCTSAGDKHRRGKHGPERHCVDPATVGLVKDDRGIWRYPSPDKPLDHWK